MRSRPQPLDVLEPRLLFSAVPLITEFLASNSDGLQDEDGDSSDWIEIYNAGDMALDLDGWHLTDDASDLSQWAFPAVSLDPGEYLVVFASSKNRADADGTELHTNFRLGAGGEYLALVEADGGTVAFEYAPQFPAQASDVSYGVAMAQTQTIFVDEGQSGRFIVPTGPTAGWNTIGYNDSGWALQPTAIGYEITPQDYASLIETEVPDGTVSLYLRHTFNVADPDAIENLSLGLRYDDGFVAYLNGVKVAEMFAPASPQWNSTAVGSAGHSDAQAAEFEPFDLTGHLGELVVGNNVLAIQVMNAGGGSSDLLIEPMLTAGVTTVDAQTHAFMAQPTPGAANILSGPVITLVTQNPPQPTATQSLVIEATVFENGANGVARVDLHRRVNFGGEGTIQMFDNGLGDDVMGGDGIYTATISSGFYASGDLVRWYVTAEDTNGTVSRAPMFSDQSGNNQSAQYFGTVVTDPAVSTLLPVFTLFVQDSNAARTDAGTRASVFYDGEFYDNVYIRRRGFTTANWNKRKFKIDFNKGDDFRYSDEAPRVSEINLQSHYLEIGGSSNTSYMREVLGFAFMQEVGVAASNAFHVHIEQNGGFFGLYSIVEQVDDDFLERNGLDPEGVLYKASGSNSLGNLRPNPTESGYNKVQPKDGSFAELVDLTNGVNASNPNRFAYLFDRINLPALVNEMAAHAVLANHDRLPKNYYMYLDPESQEWTRLPWDMEQAFTIGTFLTNGNYNSPLYGDSEHTQELETDIFNHLYDAILDNPTTREMYLRRLRTLMDTYLDASTGYFENLVNTLASQITTDANADNAIWGAGNINDGLNEILNISLPTRRTQLFNTYGPSGSGLIPDAQPANPALTIGTIDFNPAGGDQDQEYIQLINNNAYAVDLTGWTVEGAITHTFAPGTVIGAGQSLYITPKSSAFRARTTGPTGGQGLFVQQWDDGHLSSFGETITLKRANGTTAAAQTYNGAPSLAQQFLRITEVHYNPVGPDAAEQTAGFTDGDQFEFIEFINTSGSTLQLDGVHFDDNNGGVVFAFDSGDSLAAGQRGVIVSDLAAFQERYGNSINILGTYAGNLSNSGEQIKLEDATNSTIQQFNYEDGTGIGEEDWPTTPDGDGPSLVVLDTNGDYDDGNNWTASNSTHGTPGEDEAATLLGDINGDGNVNGQDLAILAANFGSTGQTLATGDITGDGNVNGQDLAILAANFGASADIATATNPDSDLGNEDGSVAPANNNNNNNDGDGPADGDANNNEPPAAPAPLTRGTTPTRPTGDTPITLTRDQQRAVATTPTRQTNALSLAAPVAKQGTDNTTEQAGTTTTTPREPRPRRFNALAMR